MLKVPEQIKFKHQEKRWSCGAAALAMIFGVDEAWMRKLVKTNSEGTALWDVVAGLVDEKVACHSIILGSEFNDVDQTSGLLIRDIIEKLSRRYPLYLGCTFVSNCGRGRDSHRHHAVAVVDGMIYDPSEDCAVPVDAFEHTFSKRLEIGSLVLIEQERPLVNENAELR